MVIYTLFKRILGTALLLGMISSSLCSCQDEDTYAEMRERENSQISNFLQRGTKVVDSETGDVLLDVPGPIKVISESTFYANDTTTNVEENEYVLLGGSGVYMQIIRKGVGDQLEEGKTATVMCRHTELNIAADTIQSSNYIPSAVGEIKPDRLNAHKQYGVIKAYFTKGAFMERYGDTMVPSGWIHPLQFIKLGPQSSPDGVAKVRLIVPSTEGQQDAMNRVYPCFYEITYEKSN